MTSRWHVLGEFALAALLGALFGFAVSVLVEGALERKRQDVSLAAVAEDGEPSQGELAGVLVSDENSSGGGHLRPAILDLLETLSVTHSPGARAEVGERVEGAPERVLFRAHHADVTALVNDHLADFDAGLVVEDRLLVAAGQGESEEQQGEWCGRSMSHGDRRLAP